MLFISDIQNYVPIKLCKTTGSVHLFKIKGTLKTRNIKLKLPMGFTRDRLERSYSDFQ